MAKRLLLAVMLLVSGIGFLAQDGVTAQTTSGDPLRVAFIYVGPVGDLGWTWAHDQGRLAIEEQFGDQVETTYLESVPENPADAERVIRDFAQQGYDVIFATSYGYMDPTINVAADFPDTQFIHISGFKRAENVSTAFGKIEEPRYVSGMIAGMKTESNKIGYVAAFPIPEVIRGINAFTLGVRAVNPEATVQVVWTNTWFDPQVEREAAEALLDGGADVITQHQDTPGPQQAAEDAGKFGIAYNADMIEIAPEAVLTSVVWNWGAYYTQVVQAMLDGTWTGNQDYWGGWQDGVVELGPLNEPLLTPEIITMAEDEIAKFSAGDETIFTIFTGPLLDNTGIEMVADGVEMTAEELLSMMWFVEGVEGTIPSS
ncbi:MAG: BMP family ABC transporter substrate-binding protein [Thermomicrobiales bacterium]